MLTNHNTLESIAFETYPNLRLQCSNGVVFDASLNAYNRWKFDQMETFPELFIEDYNAHHGMLKADGIEVVVYLRRLF